MSSLSASLVRIFSVNNLNYSDMCVNGRWVTNRYTHGKFFVKCGHCESCIQEKAARRSARIRNEYSKDRICLFVTLTYDRYSCPFVLKKDVENRVFPLPIYRMFTTRHNHEKNRNVRVFHRVVLDYCHNPDFYYAFSADADGNTSLNRLRTLSHQRGKIGVCWFRDIQNFEKRLRINFQRKYGRKLDVKFYNTTEYGECTNRPHAHILLFIRPEDEEDVRHAVSQAWPYAVVPPHGKQIQFAIDAAGYVASYVNCGSRFPKFLSGNFPPKHSYSKDFGCGLNSFLLPQVLEKVDRGLLVYPRSDSRSPSGIADFPIPKYVVNRYFPLFKGYSRLPVHDVYSIVYGSSEQDLCRDEVYSSLGYTAEDIYKLKVRLDNAFQKYHVVTGNDRFQYARDYERAWRCYRSTVYRLYVQDPSIDDSYKYYNIYEKLYKKSDDDVSRVIGIKPPGGVFVRDPNEFPQNINNTLKMQSVYHAYLKTKKVNNIAFSAMSYPDFIV